MEMLAGDSSGSAVVRGTQSGGSSVWERRFYLGRTYWKVGFLQNIAKWDVLRCFFLDCCHLQRCGCSKTKFKLHLALIFTASVQGSKASWHLHSWPASCRGTRGTSEMLSREFFCHWNDSKKIVNWRFPEMGIPPNHVVFFKDLSICLH